METKMNATPEQIAETTVKLVSGNGLMVLAVALMETAKDSVFRAIVGSALAQVAVHENWGGDLEAKRATVKQVREATADAFGILKGKSQAALWLALSVKASIKLHKEMRPTLDAARQLPDAEQAFAMVAAAVREAAGGNGLGQLENWLAGSEKAETAPKSIGEKVLAMLKKADEVTGDELKAIAELVAQEMSRRVMAEAAMVRARELAETAQEEKAAA